MTQHDSKVLLSGHSTIYNQDLFDSQIYLVCRFINVLSLLFLSSPGGSFWKLRLSEQLPPASQAGRLATQPSWGNNQTSTKASGLYFLTSQCYNKGSYLVHQQQPFSLMYPCMSVCLTQHFSSPYNLFLCLHIV